MFTKDSNGALQYETKDNLYSLLEGIDNKGYTSDIVFIYKEPKAILNEQGEVIDMTIGDVVDFVYGAFDSKNYGYIEDKIKEYEKKEEENK